MVLDLISFHFSKLAIIFKDEWRNGFCDIGSMVFGVWKQRKSFCWTTYMSWMEERNVISWNNSNQGHVKSGDMVKAWVIFKGVPMKYLALFECDRFLCLEYFRNDSNS